MIEPKWTFPASNHGQIIGKSTGDTESVKSNPVQTWVREMLQNILDARRPDSYTAKAEFSLFNTYLQDFPGKRDLEEEVFLTLKSSTNEASSLKPIYAEITNQLVNQISWVRVSDFGTTGLVGIERPHDINNNPWASFTKGSGKSTKGGVKGGSKGIGKNTAIVISDIKTFFVSTITDDSQGYQGIAKLISRQLEDDHTEGIGYFGDGKDPIHEYRSFDPTFTRESNETGTDIFIPFFSKTTNFKETVIEIALDSFLPAIREGKLCVKVQDELIDKDNYKRFVIKIKNKKVTEAGSRIPIEDYVLSSNETKWYRYGEGGFDELLCGVNVEKNIDHLNEVISYREPGIRVSMSRLPSYTNYSAILFVKGDDISQKLRALENPTHTKWDTGLAYEPGEFTAEQKKEALRLVNSFLAKCLEESETANRKEITAFKGLSGFFKDDQDDEGNDSKTYLPSKNATVSEKPKKKKKTLSKNVAPAAADNPVIVQEFAYGDKSDESTESGLMEEIIGSGKKDEKRNETEIHEEGGKEEKVKEGQKFIEKETYVASAKKMVARVGTNLFELRISVGVDLKDVRIKLSKIGCAGDLEQPEIFAMKSNDTVMKYEDGIIIVPWLDKKIVYKFYFNMDDDHNYAWEVNVYGNEK